MHQNGYLRKGMLEISHLLLCTKTEEVWYAYDSGLYPPYIINQIFRGTNN